jgi:predicted dehydrogenase
MVRVILIGNGYFGSLYRERIMRHKDYELVGIVDTDYDKLRNLRGMTVADSYDTIAQSIEHDAVVICTTPQHHAKLSINAMNRGKHVLCMKPGAMSLTEHARIGEANADNNVGWMIDYTQLRAPELDFIDAMVLSLGDSVDSVSLSRHVVTPPKPEGVILDLFPHDVATVSSLFSCGQRRVICTIEGVKATATIFDEDNDQQIAFLTASYNATYPQKYALVRIKPRDIVANPRIELAWEQNEKYVEVRSQGRSVEIRFRHEPDMITKTLDEFVWPCTFATGHNGFSKRVMRMLHAMQASAVADGLPISYRETSE